MQDKVKKIGQLVLSAVIALVLFFNATTTNYKNSVSTVQSTESETYTHTLTNIPIEIKYDSEAYFISGFSSTVNVDLIGSNRVILQRESDESTRTFQVTADLTDLEPGTHSVPLQVSNLPTGVSASLNPSEMTLKIGKKVSKTFAVQGVVYSNQLADGYMASKVSVSVSAVKVTTDEDTMALIDHVEAVVTDAANLSSDFSAIATIQAVDQQGNVLPVVLSQSEAGVQATITKIK
ncbi:hypothetical protein HO675_06240 [Streptococcus suis]|nr:hypothetical protein [Streptococcus suis]